MGRTLNLENILYNFSRNYIMVSTRKFRGGKKSKRHTHHKHHSTHRRKVKRYSRRGTKRRRRKRTKRLKRGGTRKNVMKGGAGANSLYLYIDKDEVKNYGYAKKAFMRIASASSQDIQWKTPDKPRQDVPIIITESINESAKKNVQNFIQYVLIQATSGKNDVMTVVAQNIIKDLDIHDGDGRYILKLKDFIKDYPKTLNIINTKDSLVEAAATAAAEAEAEEAARKAAEAERARQDDEGRRAIAAAEERSGGRRRRQARMERRRRLGRSWRRQRRRQRRRRVYHKDDYQDAVAAAAEAGLSPEVSEKGGGGGERRGKSARG